MISEEQRAIKLQELKQDVMLTFGIIEELRPGETLGIHDTSTSRIFAAVLQEVRNCRLEELVISAIPEDGDQGSLVPTMF